MGRQLATRYARFQRAAGVILVVCSSLAGAGAAAAQGADSTAVTSTTGNPYQACDRADSTEDRATCRKEAGAAQADARRGTLDLPAQDYQKNALQRCLALPAADQDACRMRIDGVGSTTGSVAGGGITRELVVENPPPIPAPAAVPPASAPDTPPR